MKRHALVLALAGVLAVACRAIVGIEDITVDASTEGGADGGPSNDASTDASNDAGADGGLPTNPGACKILTKPFCYQCCAGLLDVGAKAFGDIAKDSIGTGTGGGLDAGKCVCGGTEVCSSECETKFCLATGTAPNAACGSCIEKAFKDTGSVACKRAADKCDQQNSGKDNCEAFSACIAACPP